MADAHYDNPALAELYDLDCGWSPARDFYLSLASSAPRSILDLGCGTGLICNEFAARGHAVTGVDPSPAMLDIARRKQHGGTIEWILSTAQNYRSAKRFDLIIMTGHAFQVLLDEQEVEAAFDTIRMHLKPGGIAVFESRNPAINWADRWNHDYVLDGQNGPIPVSRRVLSNNNGLIAFETRYALKSGTLTSASVLRFWTRREIERHAARSALVGERLMGGWDEAPFDPETSEELIFMLQAG
jgi:SAM-dependent methyltransferase